MEDSIRVQEEQNLERCISRIDEIITTDNNFLNRPKESAPLTGEALNVMADKKKDEIRNLEEARQSPYFGRLDFVNEKTPDNIEIYYFGEYHIPLDYVFNWEAPVGKLFYNPLAGEYDSPAGKMTGVVNLKRELLIEEARLLDVVEVPLLPPGAKALPIKQTRVTRQLSESKGSEMKRIIATIQPEQYEQIASTPYRVLIIQGVAGSGKSEVGIHRIAYLLSPYNELDLSISPNRVVFFGPSRVFIKYVSNLLPGLGVERVRQTTIREWLRSTLPGRIRLERRDMLLEKLLRGSREDLTVETKIAKLKVSLQMAYILDGHVRAIRNELINNAIGIVRGKEILISKPRIRKVIKALGNRPLNEQRRMAISRIEQELGRRVLTKLDDSLREDVETQFERFWPKLDYKDVYLELLSDRNTLVTASKGTITEEEARCFSRSISGKSKTFKTEEFAAICYLNYLLNGRIHETGSRGRRIPLFEHVVIDEAQDVSPLEFLLLYLYSSNKSFTILGDIGQCILPHRGISNWGEVKHIFSKEHPYSADIRVSYRATYEITKYANRILKLIAPSLPRAVPYERHGEKPALIRSKSFNEMIKAIAEDVRSFKNQGIQTIAVLCKTSGEASKLQKRLRKEGIDDAMLLDKPGYERTNTAVSSIYLSKGLEYDAVILANARKNNFTDSVLHNRSLYIAVTRAAHYLHIHWFGTLADALVDPTLIPKNKKLTVRKNRKRSKNKRHSARFT